MARSRFRAGGIDRRSTRRSWVIGPEPLETRLVPATFVVNSLADILDPPAGTVTLRSAIQQANATPGGNTIDLSLAGTYAITRAGAGTGTNNTGAFAILPSGGDLTIANNSGGTAVIDGGGLDRVFDINPSAETGTPFAVTIQGVTIQNGKTAATETPGDGGGIRVQGAASLSLSYDQVLNCNASGAGGGVAAVNVGSNATLNVQASAFVNDFAQGVGGAIDTAAATTVAESVFQEDLSNTGGGALADSGANLILSIVTAHSNEGPSGGALLVTAPAGDTTPFSVQVSSSLFTSNLAYQGAGVGTVFNGGGIDQTAGNLTITASELDANSALGNGDAIEFSGTTLSIVNSSLLSNVNTSALDFAGTGSGSQIVNTTFASNKSYTNGGAISDEGYSLLTLVNDTITDNTASNHGGGIAVLGGQPPAFLNTIVFGNDSVATDGPFGSGPDVYTHPGLSVIDYGGNLIGTPGQGNTGFSAGTLTADPRLMPYASNGGPNVGEELDGVGYSEQLQTVALEANSQAAGAGKTTAANLGVDERGFPRPGQGYTNPAIGAYEPQYLFAPSVAFVIGTDGQVYDRPLDSAENPSGPYQLTAYGQVTDLAVTRIDNGAGFALYVVGTDHHLYTETLDSRGVSSGYSLAAYGLVASIAGASPTGVYVIGTDHQLYVTGENGPGLRLTLVGPGAFTSGSVVPGLTPPAAAPIYAVKTDGQVYGFQNDPGPGEFRVDAGAVKQVVAGHDAIGDPEIAVIGADGAVYIHEFYPSGDPVVPYVKLGVPSSSSPVISLSFSYDAYGDPLLYALNADGQIDVHRFGSNGSPSGPFVAAPAVPGGASQIAAGNDASGNPVLYAVSATDGQVYVLSLDPTGMPVGGFSLTTPGAVEKVVIG